MNKIKFLLIILITLAIGTLIILFFNRTLTGNVIQEQKNDLMDTYMYTKAICNESNFCQDYEIICENNKTKSITPLTGAVVQFDENWKDPRSPEDREKLC